MKKKLTYFLLFLALVQFTGCEAIQRKFIRKPKTPDHVASAIYFEEGPYQKKFSNDYYYKSHYVLWQTWHDDLLQNLGGNEKKTDRAAQESIGNLQQMQQYLKPEKFSQLQIIINDLNSIVKRMNDGSKTTQVGPVRTELERIRRAVGNDFYYDKIKNEILASKVDLGDQTKA